jgi:hypothetical protein
LLYATASALGWTVNTFLGEPQVYIKGLRITGSKAYADRLRVFWLGEVIAHAKPETVPAFLAALDTFRKINEM